MMNWSTRRLLPAVFLVVPCMASAGDEPLLGQARALFGVLPEVTAPDPARVALGRQLFWDTRISADGRTACASCHHVEDGSADRRPRSPDARGKQTLRNSQPVFNATLQPFLRWTGDRKDAAAQARGSLTGSMGFENLQEAEAALRANGYAPHFEEVFTGPGPDLSADNYAVAIAAYEDTLITPGPFDRFLQGDPTALDAQQRDGLRTFIETGCAGCHRGPLLGGDSLQKFGLVKDYWTETGSDPIDTGRFRDSGQEADRAVFRVAMLRNVARTAPYFHDGSVASLGQAVAIMARVQLGRELSDAQVQSIVSFLGALDGKVPDNYGPPTAFPAAD